ncbi:MAG: hypothetical protein IKJ30_00215 [Bacilli bacterium]|nr:hypothetical protein [Bacilli bacterium]
MNVVYRVVSFVISLLILFLASVIVYKSGKRKGIKKALYRITYISLCVILSFIIAPYFTDFILNLDLYPLGLAIQYNGLNFYRIIDFIEEVIVHNPVLNDIYYIFPNLKSLLIDFPHVVFIPFAYLLAFFITLVILLPVYMYLSYRRDNIKLYEVEYKNSGRVWAGILSCVQMLFVVSIVLTPINGLVRVYSDSKKGNLSYNENICNQNDMLAKYEAACLAIEAYDSSLFSMLGRNPVNEYIYDSLTRVEYGDMQTTFSSEITSIAKVGIILNKTGLLNAINTEITSVEDVTKLDFKGLTVKDIDIIISAFENSLYTREILEDVYEWSRSYLNFLLKENLRIDVIVNFTYEELVNELRVILSTINLILNNQEYIDNIYEIYEIIDEINKNSPGDEKGLYMFFYIVHSVDLESLVNIYDYLSESQIYRLVVPRLLKYVLSTIDIKVNLDAEPDEMDNTIRYIFGLVEIIQKHNAYNLFKLLGYLSDEEVEYLAIVVNYMCHSKTMKTFFFDLANYGIATSGLKLDIPTELILEVEDWTRELMLGRIVMRIIYEGTMHGYIDYDLIWYGLTHYSNTVVFDYAWRMAVDMLPDVFKMWLAGKGYRYLVGEYVD